MSHSEKQGHPVAGAAASSEVIGGLPAPVAAYLRATNLSDFRSLMATFAEDALVNDQLTDHWGKEAISAWAAREVIGERLALRVVKAVQHYGHSIVTAHADGLFDKRGLPEPLVLVLYFSCVGDKIVQLMILRDHSGI